MTRGVLGYGYGEYLAGVRATNGKGMVRYVIAEREPAFVVQRRVLGIPEFDQDVGAHSLEEARAQVPCDFIKTGRRHSDPSDVVEMWV